MCFSQKRNDGRARMNPCAREESSRHVMASRLRAIGNVQESGGGARGRVCVPGWKMRGSDDVTGTLMIAVPTGSSADCVRLGNG
jgi:hypothetical protein